MEPTRVYVMRTMFCQDYDNGELRLWLAQVFQRLQHIVLEK